MKIKSILLAATVLIAASANAQVKIPGGRSVERKVERKVERTADEILNGSNKRGDNSSRQASSGDDDRQRSRDGAQQTLKYIEELVQKPFLLKRGELLIGGDTSQQESSVHYALATSDAVIKEHEDKVEEFLQTNPSPTFTKNGLVSAQAKGRQVSSLIKQADDALKNERSIGNVYYLQQLYLYRAYLAGAIKIYPADNSLKENHDLAVAAIERMGSREGYMSKLKANYAAWVKNMRMKPAVMSDPSVEKLVKAEFQQQFASSKVTVTKVHIVTPWIIEKNGLDIPLHKEVTVNIAVKKADGTCGLASAYVRQVYEGGGRYGAAYMNMTSAIITLPCENLK